MLLFRLNGRNRRDGLRCRRRCPQGHPQSSYIDGWPRLGKSGGGRQPRNRDSICLPGLGSKACRNLVERRQSMRRLPGVPGFLLNFLFRKSKVHLFHPTLWDAFLTVVKCFEEGEGRDEARRRKRIVKDSGRIRRSLGCRGSSRRRRGLELGQKEGTPFSYEGQ